MADVHVRSLHGTQVVIPADTVGAFEATLRGSLIRPESAGYDAARSIWNGMVSAEVPAVELYRLAVKNA
jgi:hypothetical protein